MKGGLVQVHYSANKQMWAVGKLFNQGGELIAEASDLNGLGVLTFDRGVSGGIYMVDFEVRRNETVLARRILKVAVVR
jgi:hypothetical protein